MKKSMTRQGFTQGCFAKGFTLIELLVVVLIIGILATVAVPQYQKVMLRAKLARIEVLMNGLFKSMDIYVLANGIPDYQNVDMEQLDVSMPLTSYNSGEHSYYNEYGQWQLTISSYSSAVTFIGRNSMQGITFTLNKLTPRFDPLQRMRLFSVSQDLTVRQIICQWWAETHGVDTIVHTAKTQCAEVGVQ